MGSSLCAKRAAPEPTAAELRAKRLQRLAGASQPTLQESNEPGRNAGTPLIAQAPAQTQAPTTQTAAPPATEPSVSAPNPAPESRSSVEATIVTSTPSEKAQDVSKSVSSGAVVGQAARVTRKLIQDADHQTIELVLRIVSDILREPKASRCRSLCLADLRKRLRPDTCEQETRHLCIALTGIGFKKVDAHGDSTQLELADSDDLALVREIARKIDNTRCRWKPAHADEDAKPSEVMNATGCSKELALKALLATGYDTVFAIRVIADGPKAEDGTPMLSHAYILNVQNRDENSVRDVWSSQCEALPEYRHAADTICLSRRWVVHTKLGRILASIDAEFREDPARLAQMEDRNHLEEMLVRTIMKAYNLSERDTVKQQMTLPCGWKDEPCNVFDTMWHFCFIGPPRMLGGGNPQPLKYITWSLHTLLSLEEPNMIEIKLFEICDVAHRCGSARKQTFNSLVIHCCALRDAAKIQGSSPDMTKSSRKTPRELALARLEECMEDFLDDHKTRAFTSAFIAPTRYYLHHTGHEAGSLNVTVHGLNWYLTLVHATLGMPLPLSGHYDDHQIHDPSLVDYWKGLTDKAWPFFSDPANFGKYFADLPTLPEDVKFIGDDQVKVGELPEGMNPGPKAMCFGNSAVNPGHDHAPMRQKLAIYLERFAYFFRAEFFARKAFETLNSESKPEHVGFRDAVQVLYSHYRMENLGGAGEEDLLEHCYKDEYFMKPDVSRMINFFSWLGIIKDDVGPDLLAQAADEPDSDTSDLFS